VSDYLGTEFPIYEKVGGSNQLVISDYAEGMRATVPRTA